MTNRPPWVRITPHANGFTVRVNIHWWDGHKRSESLWGRDPGSFGIFVRNVCGGLYAESMLKGLYVLDR